MKKLWKRFSDWLIEENSFWDSIFKWILCKPYRIMSLGSHLNNYYKCLKYNNSNKSIKADKDLIRVPRISELYQICSVLIGAILLLLIQRPLLTAEYWKFFGIFIAVYRLWDIFFASLNWLFVDKGPVKDFRRSLAMFMVNMIEISLFLSIAYILLHPNLNAWDTVVESFKAVFGLKHLTEINKIILNPYLALFQIIIFWFLYAVILANVVGGIRRGEKADYTQGKP